MCCIDMKKCKIDTKGVRFTKMHDWLKARIDTKGVTIDTNCAKFPRFEKSAKNLIKRCKIDNKMCKIDIKGVRLTQNVQD